VATVRLALAQMNAVVGGLGENVATLQRLRHQATALQADLMISPELAVTGYPPEDLLLKEGFIAATESVVGALSRGDGPPLLVGTVVAESEDVPLAPSLDGRTATPSIARPRIANALVALDRTGQRALATKQLLPNYDVFDEQRYFHPGVTPGAIVNVRGVAIGLLICEDIWTPAPARQLVDAGATLLVVANASPFARGRRADREAMLAQRAVEAGCPIAYVNMVGGQDELVFDGQSVVVDATGTVIARADAFQEELLIVDVEAASSTVGVGLATEGNADERGMHVNYVAEPRSDVAEVYEALVTGTRDYLRKNGFRSAVIGLSGGVDSSLVATIAVDALGAQAVRGVAMPSRYSSDHSLLDAYALAERLDIAIDTIAIEPAHDSLTTMLTPALGAVAGLTDENLQSRIRGVLLMALSNATGAIVLTTGNKSEMATGYSTLYGDSAGGFAVIKDVAKTLVYELCHYRNDVAALAGDPAPIPESVLTKAPSAELRPDQRDDQSLPPYDVLDALLERYVESDDTVDELVTAGYDAELVRRIAGLVDRSEYKRRQMPPGVRISKKAFGRDRRMPITNNFRPSAQ